MLMVMLVWELIKDFKRMQQFQERKLGTSMVVVSCCICLLCRCPLCFLPLVIFLLSLATCRFRLLQ